MRDGQAGLGHPPWQGQAEACVCGSRGGFLKGSERPEAGCLGDTQSHILSVKGGL